MDRIGENIYKSIFKISETALVLAKTHLSENPKKFQQLRDYVVALSHQQKRRAKKEFNSYEDKETFLKGVLLEVKFKMESTWKIFFKDEFPEAIELINESYNNEIENVESILR